MSRSSQTRPSGFTLIELMVVVAIISILLTLTVPAIKGMMETSQLAQAENLMRSTLLSARSYAMKNCVVAGLRFQEDGHMVLVYAENYADVFTPDAHYQDITYQMRAVPERLPERLPDPWRVTTLDLANMDGYDPGVYWFPTWKAAPEWCDTDNAWFVYPLVLFDANGRLMLGKAQFPTGWYPSTSGSFDKLTGSGVTWAHQPYRSTPQGPHITTSLRLFNYFEFRGCEVLDDALIGMSATASDSYINMNTGMLVRRHADTDMRLNQ